MLHAWLADGGYLVEDAVNGAEALTRLYQQTFCLVLLDMQMPVMDGWTFRARQLQDPRVASIPVLGLTAVIDPSSVERTLGVRCLSKPIDFEQLLEHVQAICG